jgi:5-methylcytosine-specific restriction endonuclease McrA
MSKHPYYQTQAWRRLRAARLELDGGRCITPGCGAPAVIVDHINSVDVGKAVPLARLRSLCRQCDNQIKEGRNGKRRGGGVAMARGCDAQGNPLSPDHWWNR